MTIQDAETPCAHHEEAGRREENSNDMNRECALFVLETRRDEVNQHRGEQDSQ
jgi:hypothetical protein